jgi:hypothetical protein
MEGGREGGRKGGREGGRERREEGRFILLLREIFSLNIFTQSSSKKQIFRHEFQEGVWKIRYVTTVLLEIVPR